MTSTGNNGQTATVYEPGYTLDLTSGTPNVRPTTTADINAIMAALTKGEHGRHWHRPARQHRPAPETSTRPRR